MKFLISTLATVLALTACAEGRKTTSDETLRRDFPFQSITFERFASGGKPIDLQGDHSATQIVSGQWHSAQKARTQLGSGLVDMFWRRIDSHELLAIANIEKPSTRFRLFDTSRALDPTRVREIREAVPGVTGCGVTDMFQSDVPKTHSGIMIAVLDCD